MALLEMIMAQVLRKCACRLIRLPFFSKFAIHSYVLVGILSFTPFYCQATSSSQQILYLMQAGNTAEALSLYCDIYKNVGSHNHDLIQNMGLILLDQGYRSNQVETQVLTLFGAGISMNERAFYILEEGLCSSSPQMQAIALHFLSKQKHSYTDDALNKAMKSDFLPIRLEAAYQLCLKNHPSALDQTESLMVKLPEELLPLFPQMYAALRDKRSIPILRRLLAHPDEQVRVETILSITENKRDEFLPQIRSLALQASIAQQEACATALGAFQDLNGIDTLRLLGTAKTSTVRLAALQALYKMGNKDSLKSLLEEAAEGNLFAIQAVGAMEGSEATLVALAADSNIQVRVNASLALLQREDPRCLIGLGDIFLRDARDILLTSAESLGHSLSYYKVIPCGHQQFPDSTIPFELSLHLREEALAKAVELPEKEFLALADLLMTREQNDLIPMTVALVENIGTPEALALLKKHQQKVGAPLVRNYCNLALFRLKTEGPYAAVLQEWMTKQADLELIQFRPLLPRDIIGTEPYDLTPKEASRLLIEAFEAFASTQDDKGINLLLEMIQNGNSKNKYALAGLLMRAGQ